MRPIKKEEKLDLKRLTILALLLLGIFLLKETNILNIIKALLIIVSPLFIGFILAWLFEPIIKILEKQGVRRILGVILTYVLFIGIIILFLYLVIPSFTSQISDFVKSIPNIIKYFTDFIDKLFDSFVTDNFDLASTKDQVLDSIENFGLNLSKQLPEILINTIKIFITGSINFLVGIIIGFYISLDFRNAKRHFLALVPKKAEKDLVTLFRKLDTNLKDFVYGTLFTSLIVAFFSMLGFMFAGLKAPILFALFCGITNIIPYFGPYIGGIPAIIVGFSISPVTGMITLVTVIIVQFIEGNFINPLVMSKAINLHPITIVISLLIFEHFFGIMGMVVATPLISTGKIIFEFFQKKYNLMKIFNR